MDRKKEFLLRVYIVLGMFILVAIALVGKAFYISEVQGDKWRDMATELYFKLMPVEAERGKILSDDGSPLAISLPFFEIRMDTKAKGLTKEVFKKNVDALADALSKNIMPDKSPEEIKNYLVRARQKEMQYLLIARSVDYQQLEELKTYPIFKLGQNKGGLIVIRKNRREKPFKLLANRTIGLHRDSLSIGLEDSFNKYLKGEEGERLMKKVDHDEYIPVNDVTEIEAKKGADVMTTLNVSLQEVTEEALAEAMINHNATKACAVVMETSTGAIKAIANLGRDENGELVENYNYAVAYSSEPGSTLKLASVMAMMEEGAVNINTPVDLNGGVYYFYDKKMPDSKIHGIGQSNLKFAFENSSNVGISRLANNVFANNPSAFASYYEKFHLINKSGIELNGEPKPIIKNPKTDKDSWYGTTVPWMSVGYEMQLTPLQILNFYNSVANDGKMMKPYIVSKILENDEPVKIFTPKVMADSMYSESTLNQIKELLKGVVEEGTAKILKNDQYSIAGKTGTAVTNYHMVNAETKEYQASFCGYFPADAPKYSCIVVVYNPTQGGYYGADAAGPAFKKIADHCMRELHVTTTPINMEPKPVLASEHLPVGNYGSATDFKNIFNHVGLPFRQGQNSEWIRTISAKEGVFTVAVENKKGIVPDVTGMGLRDAMFLLDKSGYKVLPHGIGKVISQSIPAGTSISNTIIELYLE